MRETVKTLKLYFGLSSAYAILTSIRALSLAQIAVGIVGLAFGVAYLYLSILLPKLLKNSLGTIKWVLIAASACLGIALLSGLILGNISQSVVSALGLAINWYLFRNAKRLGAELRSSPVIAQVPS
jgi:hypothetical protein